MTQTYIIRSNEDRDFETNEPLYWSNDDGWGFQSTATIFTAEQRDTLNLPLGDCEWEATSPEREET